MNILDKLLKRRALILPGALLLGSLACLPSVLQLMEEKERGQLTRIGSHARIEHLATDRVPRFRIEIEPGFWCERKVVRHADIARIKADRPGSIFADLNMLGGESFVWFIPEDSGEDPLDQPISKLPINFPEMAKVAGLNPKTLAQGFRIGMEYDPQFSAAWVMGDGFVQVWPEFDRTPAYQPKLSSAEVLKAASLQTHGGKLIVGAVKGGDPFWYHSLERIAGEDWVQKQIGPSTFNLLIWSVDVETGTKTLFASQRSQNAKFFLTGLTMGSDGTVVGCVRHRLFGWRVLRFKERSSSAEVDEWLTGQMGFSQATPERVRYQFSEPKVVAW